MKELPPHVIVRPLNTKDLDQVVELEEQCFSKEEKMTREKAEYRLKACPELCAGVFIRTFKQKEPEKATKYNKDEDEDDSKVKEEIEDRDEDYEDIDSSDENEYGNSSYNFFERPLPSATSLLQSEELIGQLIATKTTGLQVTDDSMEIPDLDEYGRIKDSTNDRRGHHEEGRTIALHSVCVREDYRNQSIASVLIKDYVQRLSCLHIADRISIIARENLVPFYSKLGFNNQGDSACQHGGGVWKWLWIPLLDPDYDDDEDEE